MVQISPNISITSQCRNGLTPNLASANVDLKEINLGFGGSYNTIPHLMLLNDGAHVQRGVRNVPVMDQTAAWPVRGKKYDKTFFIHLQSHDVKTQTKQWF